MSTRALETDRLLLQPTELAHAEALFAVYSNDDAMRFMPTPPHTTVDTTRNMLAHDMGLDGAHHWSIVHKEDDRIIGVVNYLGATFNPGMGYILHPDYWGRGITTAACRMALDEGFAQFGYDRVELWIDQGNGASRRVAAKLGFHQHGTMLLKYVHQPTAHKMLVYGMWIHDWPGHPAETPVPAVPPVFSADLVLHVPDVAATVTYYEQKLGFRRTYQVGEPMYRAGLAFGNWSGSGMHLHVTATHSSATKAYNSNLYVLLEHSLDDLHMRLRANGVAITSEPQDQPWGRREFTIEDCNGFTLLFAQPI